MKKSFKHIADNKLRSLLMDERLKQAVRHKALTKTAAVPAAPRRLTRRAVLALILLSMLTLTAFALTDGFGLFKLMDRVMPGRGEVRGVAYNITRTDLSFYAFEHVDVAVREAVYDGRMMRVAYSVTDRAATEPLAEPGSDVMEGRPGILRFPAAELDNIAYATLDWVEIDGEHYSASGASTGVAGPENGQVITWVQFDLSGVELQDVFTVHLPLRGNDTPRALDFQLSKSDLQGVYALRLPREHRANNYVIRVQDAFVSPIRTYLTTRLVADAGVSIDECTEILNTWVSRAAFSGENGEDPKYWVDFGSGFISNVVSEPSENNPDIWVDRIIDPSRPVTMVIYHQFMPHDPYPEVFRYGPDAVNSILIPNIPQ